MSRDLRPFESYIVIDMLWQRGEIPQNEFPKFTMHYGDVKEPMWDDEMREKYPLTEGLASLNEIYRAYKQYPKAMEVFHQIECCLEKEVHDLSPIAVPQIKMGENVKFAPIEAVVHDWFYGLLDANAHYMTYNTEYFNSYVADKIESVIKPKSKDSLELP